jgi:predicted outer membrane protein
MTTLRTTSDVHPIRLFLLTAAMLIFAAATLGGCDDDDDDNETGVVTLTDAQIVGVAATANQGEIDAANVYLPRGQDANARQFAQRMITEHTATLQRQMALAQSLGLSPAPSTTQAQLQAMASQTVTTLDATPASRIDLAYMESQVVMHSEVLRLLDDQLIPNATIGALREDLVRTRADVAAHLEMARSIRDTLAIYAGQ